MPLLQETLVTVGSRLERCESRSLVLERFADSTQKGDDRRDVFNRAIGKRSQPYKRDAWRDFLLTGLALKPGDLLFAQLQARLMVNMAGGVMENAGLCLDRLTGIPYIPGSAVKGCARRMAIQLLLEEPDPSKKTTLLVQIARVFGWADQDWKNGSDFSYACGTDWEEVRERTVKLLFDANPNWKKPTGNQPLWKALPNFAGSVNFLPAYPLDLGKTGKVNDLPLPVPELGKLEIDVVTCHHREYYNDNPQYATAPDTEEPVPVVFPAVAPGHVFVFAVLPGQRSTEDILAATKQWLKQGLETFGLGAKIAAGYGWFDCSEAVQMAATDLLHQKVERVKKEAEEKAAREKAEAEAKAKAAEKAAREAALANLSPDERADKEIELMTPAQFENKVRAFHKEPKKGGPTEEQKKAIVRALRGPRLDFWNQFKTNATKGDLANAANAIRQLSKRMFGEKEGKMP